MTAEPAYNKHFLSLAAVFILGDAVIALPYAAGDYAFWGFILSAVAAVVLPLITIPAAGWLFGKNRKGVIFKAVGAVMLTAVSLYAFYNAGLTFKRYMNFVNSRLLPEGHAFFIALVFIILLIFLASRRQETVLKLSLVFFAVSVITVILFFLLTAKDFKSENIAVYRMPRMSELFAEAKPYFSNVSLPVVLIPFYSAAFSGGKSKGGAFCGVSAGLLLMSLCLLDCLLLFGAPLSARLPFPLADAVSTVTVGPLFTRMDGVIYCLFFMTALLKCAVCARLSIKSVMAAKKMFD